MNCHPNHTPLTAADMEAIALAHGLIDAHGLDVAHGVHEKAAMFLDFIAALTRDVRFTMMDTGDLVLDTAAPFVPTVKVIAIDPDVVALKAVTA